MSSPTHVADPPRLSLPETVRDTLRQLRGEGDAVRWALGDIAVELCDEFADTHTKKAVLDAVSDEAGVMPATVRRYEETARAYQPIVRTGFPELTWYHFAAVRFQPNKLEWLLQAAESADDYNGNPMPVRVLAAKMVRADTAPALDALLDRAVALLDRAAALDLAQTLTRLWAWRDGAVGR